jgi:hypothetical protein
MDQDAARWKVGMQKAGNWDAVGWKVGTEQFARVEMQWAEW